MQVGAGVSHATAQHACVPKKTALVNKPRDHKFARLMRLLVGVACLVLAVLCQSCQTPSAANAPFCELTVKYPSVCGGAEATQNNNVARDAFNTDKVCRVHAKPPVRAHLPVCGHT